MTPSYVSPALQEVRQAFVASGFDVRLVGGCVRDTLCGVIPKDIDLCTNATPDEQLTVYGASGFRYIPTGISHGTITVVNRGETFEITSLRGETEHDGRHAKVFFHHDWEADQARRDLTINSMMMDFDGVLYDPFDGATDLKAGVVRFVGDPIARMREDYLRILRWLRFHARFGKNGPLDPDAADAAMAVGKGLKDISAERVWSEVARIAVGPSAGQTLHHMMALDIAHSCGMPHGAHREVQALEGVVTDPVTMMVAFLIEPMRVAKLSERWKWSSKEMTKSKFLADGLMDYDPSYRRMLAKDRINLDWVIDLARLQRQFAEAEELRRWPVPLFPVKGQDLINHGMTPGPEVGKMVEGLRMLWADSGYEMSRDDLLSRVKL
jgi:tRNA nucleotidyltransferase (CCA-adding enzyme)